ncbi:MAG: alpha/beta hydrolase [Cytophagales bacterium]|nr:alpha/beta hydrolase [Cytophagales bacterium]
MKTIPSKTIVFITGAFVSHHCWDEWQTYFQSKGYTTLAPPWLHKDASAKELRDRQPHDVALATLHLNELIDHYAGIIGALPEKPIVIGHSYGGMLTQIMVNRDLAAAGVAIHSVPPLGVFPYEFSFLKAGWKSLGLFTSLEETYLMSFEDWQYAFVNGMSLEDQHESYVKYIIPESKTVARDALTGASKVDFAKPHAPLLFIAGDTDHITPAHLNLRNFKAYESNGSVLDYKLFIGRNHYVLGLPTWQEEADYILDWIGKVTPEFQPAELTRAI